MIHQEFLRYLREEFDKRLSEKTNFGRNQAKKMFDESICDAYARSTDDLLNSNGGGKKVLLPNKHDSTPWEEN